MDCFCTFGVVLARYHFFRRGMCRYGKLNRREGGVSESLFFEEVFNEGSYSLFCIAIVFGDSNSKYGLFKLKLSA